MFDALLSSKRQVEATIVEEYNKQFQHLHSLAAKQSISLTNNDTQKQYVELTLTIIKQQREAINKLNYVYQKYFEQLLNHKQIIANFKTMNDLAKEKKSKKILQKLKYDNSSQTTTKKINGINTQNFGKDGKTLRVQKYSSLYTLSKNTNKFDCKLCNYNCAFVGTMAKHLNRMHKIACEKATIEWKFEKFNVIPMFNYFITKIEKNSRGRLRIHGKYKCLRCNKIVSSKDAAIGHSNSHDNIKLHEC